MENLINVVYDNDRITVSARELHGFLGIESNFTTWFRRMCEYGFEQEIDFIPFLEKSNGGRPSTDYQLTIEMAKEISMIQRNEKGKQARQYFIACEKKLSSKQYKLPTSPKEILALIVADNEERDQRIEKLEKRVSDLSASKLPWREQMLKRVRKECEDRHISFPTRMKEIYDAIEHNEHCNLDVRLKKLKERFISTGHSRKEADALHKIDAIACDKRLKAAFEELFV